MSRFILPLKVYLFFDVQYELKLSIRSSLSEQDMKNKRMRKLERKKRPLEMKKKRNKLAREMSNNQILTKKNQ